MGLAVSVSVSGWQDFGLAEFRKGTPPEGGARSVVDSVSALTTVWPPEGGDGRVESERKDYCCSAKHWS